MSNLALVRDDAHEEQLAEIQQVLDLIGYKSIRPLRNMVFVLNYPQEYKTHGGIWIAPNLQKFFGDLPHMRQMKGLVLASGPHASVKPGDTVAFMRLHFAWWKDTPDPEVKIGFLNENDILGHVENEETPAT